MSDYGEDDFSDYGDDWLYVEDEYTAADDLAEHVAPSPPPTTYLDDDPVENWDRFDYFNDLEYASDGYDDGTFYAHKAQNAQVGQKRKRGTAVGSSKKRQKAGTGYRVTQSESSEHTLSPIVWRSRADRESKPKLLDHDTESYALLKDWRERMADTPAWAAGSPASASPSSRPLGRAKGKAAIISELSSPILDDKNDEGDAGIDPSVLMAALQKNLAEQGGPLSGMDPQQLLQFTMRMMSDQDAGHDIAGELADDILNRGEYDEDDGDGDGDGDGEAPADLLSWLSKQRKPNHVGSTEPDTASSSMLPKSPEAKRGGRRPPTPPSSKTTRSIPAVEEPLEPDQAKDRNASTSNNNTSRSLSQKVLSRKREADDDANVSGSATALKKRATRSYDAPTTASQARLASTE